MSSISSSLPSSNPYPTNVSAGSALIGQSLKAHRGGHHHHGGGKSSVNLVADTTDTTSTNATSNTKSSTSPAEALLDAIQTTSGSLFDQFA